MAGPLILVREIRQLREGLYQVLQEQEGAAQAETYSNWPRRAARAMNARFASWIPWLKASPGARLAWCSEP